ncbi:MAG TPA: selenium-dependent molybdenum cofactor biosynthesis protein YqeB [Anaerolineae bacterium]|nr:selenium-dependent molybdenum cofactor biosynthesis protein YqeB [Anaerolineae bacterium]HOR00349.1 selenium-dependent molybdenum cofactor biosynthesis protein YqeB [Anaerolineae bacterium]HPL26927.1 selenium-dependent molybdenum cofactor biosynthesis protein YqeB [Anaerolineae bacterium]
MSAHGFTAGLVLIRGAGDIASGIAHRLHRAGLAVVMAEAAQPRALRRAVSFAGAVYDGSITVEGVVAQRAASPGEAQALVAQGRIAVIVDPDGHMAGALRPEVIVDAIMAKRNLGTRQGAAPLVIGVGPGFVAGGDVDAVIETMRGHNLGRVIYEGSAAANTGVPGEVLGYTRERVVWSPAAGTLRGGLAIGARVAAGDAVAEIAGLPVVATVGGVLRGLLRNGLSASAGEKIGDVDPRGVAAYCFTISDKARAVGGAVLEAIIHARPSRT